MVDTLRQSEEATLEQEHTVQILMIDLLGQAISNDLRADEKLKILDQLIAYTEAHFMSEQLVMRQHSYEGFDAHDGEHDALMERLNVLKSQVQSDSVTLNHEAIDELRSMLLGHIATHDRQLSNYLKAE